MDKPLYPGETYTLSWERAEVAFYNAAPGEKDATSWIRFQYAGTNLDSLSFGHEVLRPYLKIMPTPSYGEQIQYRTAHGRLDFAPPLDKTYHEALFGTPLNVIAGGAGEAKLRPEKASATAVLVYAVRSPYPVVDGEWTGTFRAGKDDSIKVAIAYADWRTRDYTVDQVLPAQPQWKSVWESKGGGPHKMSLKAADLGLRGEYQYLVKLELTAAADAKQVGVDELKFSNVLQQSQLALPRLLPGKNIINVSSGSMRPGYQLRVCYVWDDAKGKDRKAEKMIERAPFTFEIEAAGTAPKDVRTKTLTLEAVKK